MKAFRRVIFWCHLVAGAIAGTIVLIMSVTGVLLTFERQILSWADTRQYRSAPPSDATPRLSPGAIIAAVRAGDPSVRVTSLTLWADRQSPASVVVGQRTMFVNPYTGQVLGEGSSGTRAFFRRVTDWHRWLGVSAEGRATARAITGACNLAFLFLVVSGFYLWLPRSWTWRQVRAVLWFRRGLPGKARDFNWHNVIGLWSAIPLFVVVLSGVVISYPWAGNLVYRIAGEAPPARAAAPAGGPSAGARAGATAAVENAPPLDAIDRLWAGAERKVDGWKSISMRLPASAAAPVAFTIDEGDGGQPQKRSTLTLDARTGDVVRWEPFASLTPGRRLRSYLRFSHTGEAAGLMGQAVAGLASAGGAVLVWTGLSLALRRFWAWRQSRVVVRATPFGAAPEGK